MTVATYPVACHVCGRMVPKDLMRFRSQFEDTGSHKAGIPRRRPLVRYLCGPRCARTYFSGAFLGYLETMYGNELRSGRSEEVNQDG